MDKRYLLALILLIVGLCTFSAKAQRSMYCDSDLREKMRQEYMDLVTTKLELNQAQQRTFLPLLRELDEKRFDIWREAHREGKQIQPGRMTPEAVYQSYLDAILDARIHTAQLEKEYYTRFGKLIPASKLIKLREVNREFGRRIASKVNSKSDL